MKEFSRLKNLSIKLKIIFINIIKFLILIIEFDTLKSLKSFTNILLKELYLKFIIFNNIVQILFYI